MNFRELLDIWAGSVRPVKTAREYRVRLPLDDAAKIHALADMFQGHTEEDIITDLLGAALHEIEASMPYRPGTKVISHDEQGDPVYEDAGQTPRFLELTRKYRKTLAREPRAGGKATD